MTKQYSPEDMDLARKLVEVQIQMQHYTETINELKGLQKKIIKLLAESANQEKELAELKTQHAETRVKLDRAYNILSKVVRNVKTIDDAVKDLPQEVADNTKFVKGIRNSVRTLWGGVLTAGGAVVVAKLIE